MLLLTGRSHDYEIKWIWHEFFQPVHANMDKVGLSMQLFPTNKSESQILSDFHIKVVKTRNKGGCQCDEE